MPVPGYLDLDARRGRATYADLNRNFGASSSSDLLFDRQAISQSLFNIFSTVPGEAGPIFNPEFGSLLPNLLQEPMDNITLFKLRAAVIQAVQRWEPRVDVDLENTEMDIDLPSLSYKVRLAYFIRATGDSATSNLSLSPLSPVEPAAPFSSLEFAIQFHSIGWPGMYEYCRLVGTALRYHFIPFWEGLTYWSDFLEWGSGTSSSVFIRYTTVIDRGFSTPRRLQFSARGASNEVILFEVATSADGVSYSAFSTLSSSVPIDSRFYKVRITSTGADPALLTGSVLMFV